MAQTTLDLDGAKRIMASRTLITQPGKYHLKVTNDVRYLAEKCSVHKELPGGKMQVSIANLAACTPFHLKKFQTYVKEGDFDTATRKSNLSVSIRDNDYMPQKNEIVEVNVGYVTTKEGEEALLVTSYNPLPVSRGTKLSVETLLKEETESTRTQVRVQELG